MPEDKITTTSSMQRRHSEAEGRQAAKDAAAVEAMTRMTRDSNDDERVASTESHLEAMRTHAAEISKLGLLIPSGESLAELLKLIGELVALLTGLRETERVRMAALQTPNVKEDDED